MAEQPLHLASVDDVKRIRRIEASTDLTIEARLRAAREAVESMMMQRLWNMTGSGAQLEVFWDVPEDATLRMPAPDVTVTAVKAFEYPSSAGVPLSPIELGLGHGYDLTDNGDLILRPTLFVSPFEGASAQRRLRQYARVEVHYMGTGVVPEAVQEGIAFLAAGWYQDGPRALSGLTDEKIGDYSYTINPTPDEDGMPSFYARGMMMLAPFLRRSRVAVI